MIVAVDYGAGNLANVLKAFRYLGEEVSSSSSPTTIRQADGIILPGVGAFGSAMDELKKRRLDQVLYEEARAGRCLVFVLGCSFCLMNRTNSEFMKDFI